VKLDLLRFVPGSKYQGQPNELVAWYKVFSTLVCIGSARIGARAVVWNAKLTMLGSLQHGSCRKMHAYLG